MTRHQSNLRASSGTSFVLSCYACYGITMFGNLGKLFSIQSVKIDYNSRRRHSWTFGRVPPSLTRTRGVTIWRSRPAPQGSSHRRAASLTMRHISPRVRSSSIGGPWYPTLHRYVSRVTVSILYLYKGRLQKIKTAYLVKSSKKVGGGQAQILFLIVWEKMTNYKEGGGL